MPTPRPWPRASAPRDAPAARAGASVSTRSDGLQNAQASFGLFVRFLRPQRLAQLAIRAGELRLREARRPAHQASNFLVRITLDVVQPDDGARGPRQRVEGAGGLGLLRGLPVRAGDVPEGLARQGARIVRARGLDPLAYPRRAQPAEAFVDRDLPDPMPDAGVAAELAGLADHL